MKVTIPGVVLAFLFLDCRPPIMQHIERSGFLMDTVIRISLYDSRPENALYKLADEVFATMLAIENRVSAYIQGSDVQRLNEEAGDDFIPVGKDTQTLLEAAQKISEETGGAFDITIGPLKALWGFESEKPRVPDAEEIEAYLTLGNYHQVELKGRLARISVKGLGIDLGGIAKGYIIDAAVQWLQDAGIQSGLVECGGDLRVFGHHPNKPYWKIGIQNPRDERGSLIGLISLNDLSVATSGDYERFFIKDGIRYHHILNPESGFPARGAISVTVIAPDAMTADALATAVFVMGADAGLSLIDSIPNVEALILTENADGMATHFSAGARGMIQMLSFAKTQSAVQ
jgi:thiamine biosynthesis lipoprotein